LVAKADPACSSARDAVGFSDAPHDIPGVRLHLLDEGSPPELAAFLNLTSCTDVAFVPEGKWTWPPTAFYDVSSPQDLHIEHLLPDSKEEFRSLAASLLGVDAAFCDNLPIAVKVFWLDGNDIEIETLRLAAGQCHNTCGRPMP